MVDLILRPSAMHKDPRVRWALQLRWHESLGETEYATLARVTDRTAQDVLDAGPAYFLFRNEPADWKAELEQLEPEAMRPEELIAEVHRLRAQGRGAV